MIGLEALTQLKLDLKKEKIQNKRLKHNEFQAGLKLHNTLTECRHLQRKHLMHFGMTLEGSRIENQVNYHSICGRLVD